MKRLILFGALCLPAFLAGCIHNDLPYPVVTINIEAIEAEGLDGAAQINARAADRHPAAFWRPPTSATCTSPR